MPSSSSKSKSKSKKKESSSSSSSSSIKGGGRTVLSGETEDLIVDLLMKLRDEKNPLLPRKTHGKAGKSVNDGNGEGENDDSDHDIESDKDTKGSSSSSHAQKRERKRFLKRLVECHQRDTLSRKLNRLGIDGALSDGGGSSANDNASSVSAAAQHTSANKGKRGDMIADTSGDEVVTGKVRIDLVEAIYESSSKKSKKDKDEKKKSSSSKKKTNKRPWKDGPVRKTLVLQRSTPIKDVLKDCKSKLRMKKKPIRCFVIGGGESNIEMELKLDLRGLEDGALVYVTSHDGKEVKKDEEKEKATGGSDGQEDEEITPVDTLDPLESVKKAYASRRNRKRMRESKNSRVGVKHPSQASDIFGEEEDQSVGQSQSLSEILEHLEPLPQSRADLPAAAYREEILKALDTTRVVVICGATGCGKSTQVPQYLLEYMNARNLQSRANILVTQPRRVAATSLAERVAEERSSPPPGKPGSVVGYNVRLSRAVTETTKIVYCTVGILLRMLVNPSENNNSLTTTNESSKNRKNGTSVPLASLSHVVIDEVHERDLNTDFVLTLLRPVLKVNPHIRIILMSATASADLFSNYFRASGIAEPKILSIPGRTFPVTTFWLSDCERFTKARIRGWVDHRSTSADDAKVMEEIEEESGEVPLSPRAAQKIDDIFVCRLVCSIAREQQKSSGGPTKAKERQSQSTRSDGAILIFLPGKGEIESLAKVLSTDSLLGNKNSCRILRLHSTLPRSEQNAIFQPVQSGIVKIVLATNVAETSITIPDVSAVIDTGRVKESRFNSMTRIKELVTVWTSRASATQRAGRAGRTGPGICYKLYSEEFAKDCMLERTSPEIFRTPLDELILQVCLLDEQKRGDGIDEPVSASAATTPVEGTSPIKFLQNAPEPPTTRNLLHACKHLLEVGALTITGREPEGLLFRLTPLGYHLSHLPMDAKVGKVLIVGCILECVDPALTIAAALSCSKSCWMVAMRDPKDGTYSKQKAREAQEALVRNGFGGEGWKGGTVKGDLIAVVAAYNAWTRFQKEKERRQFAFQNALDHNALYEMNGLRSQFRGYLIDAGFLDQTTSPQSPSRLETATDDAILTSCCLVAGLYPNIATLLRPAKGRGNIKGGRLITKEGDVCRPSSSSFQVERIRNAAERGKDAYAVFHAKHRTVGTQQQHGTVQRNESFLSEVNFVSRYALLLFGGEVDICDNAIVLDDWLKFKVGDKGQTGAVLIQELRKELDIVMMKHILMETDEVEEGGQDNAIEKECLDVMEVVRKLLVSE